MKLKSMLLLSILPLTLQGCITPMIFDAIDKAFVNQVFVVVKINQNVNANQDVIYKLTPHNQGCTGLIKGTAYASDPPQCDVGQFVPETFTVEYLVRPKDPLDTKFGKYLSDFPSQDAWTQAYNAHYKNIETRALNYAQSAPASAWKKHTIYPKKLTQQRQHELIGEQKLPPIKHDGSILTITLTIDSQGNVTETLEHKPRPKGNPFA